MNNLSGKQVLESFSRGPLLEKAEAWEMGFREKPGESISIPVQK